jgi:alcohol dehydrogenase
VKALLLHAPRGALEITDVADPVCPPDGALVALEACGICRSDHHAWVGADPDVVFPHVMGHELAGRVLETGPELRGFAPGDRVTAPFILSCGRCAECTGGEPTACDAQKVIGFSIPGAFAEVIAVPHAAANLVRLPDALPFDIAAGMGCRVTTAWRAVTQRGALAEGEWLAVHGCGGVGLSAIMIGRALGARVAAVDPAPEARALARALGAEATFDAPGAAEAIRAATGGGAHVSLDALGITATFEASLRSLRKLGRHVQVGMPVGAHASPPLPLLELVYARQLSLHGTRGMAAGGFPALFELMERGRLDLSALITERVALSETGRVLASMDHGQKPGVAVITDFTR